MKRKINIKKFILFISMLIFIIGIVFSSYKIIRWKTFTSKGEKQIKEIQEEVKPIEIDETKTQVQEISPTEDKINTKLVEVDIKTLKEKNTDSIGWIIVEGTDINYPIVKYKDNDYYMSHSFDKTYNEAGWIFLDYRNDENLTDKNNIIYGHSMLNGSMFGTLKNILRNTWFNNKNNHIIKVSTEKYNYLWQVFSVYHIKETNDYLQVDYRSDEDYAKFLNKIKGRSAYIFDTTVSTEDKILTLSSCYSNNERVVLHAKLIKMSY